MTNNYTYQSLPAGPFIRVLAIQPAKKLEDPLVCNVEVVSLDNDPTYAALSYTWGTSTETHEIACNGKTFQSATNLFRALGRFRQYGVHRCIWADAICINQGDAMERNEQILLMKRIYQQGKMTYVYLGEQEDQPRMPNAVECLEKWIFQPMRGLSEPTISVSALIRLLHQQDAGTTTEDLLQGVLKSSSMPQREDSSAWMAWQIFLIRPWFNRIWVIQEATAAPERTVVQVGAFRLPWVDFIAANIASMEFLSESDVNQSFSIYGGLRVGDKKLDAIEAIARWKANRVNLQVMDSISHLLHAGEMSNGVNPDRVVKYGSGRKLSPVRDWGSRANTDYLGVHADTESEASVKLSSAKSESIASTPSIVEEKEEGEKSQGDEDSEDEPPPEEPIEESNSSGSIQEAEAEGEDVTSGDDHNDDKARGRRYKTKTNRLKGRHWQLNMSPSSEVNSVHEWTNIFKGTADIQSRHLFQLLKRCCNFTATDPRDHLYALLGLASDAAVVPKPDYTKSKSQVYRQYSEYFISQGYGLELLSMTDTRMEPSWVPDFATLDQNVPGYAKGWDRRHFSGFLAGGSAKSHMNICLQGDHVSAKGLIVDSVVALGPLLHSSKHFVDKPRAGVSMTIEKLKLFESHVTQWDKETIIFLQRALESGTFKAKELSELIRLYNITISTGEEGVHKNKAESILEELGPSSYSTEVKGGWRRAMRDFLVDNIQGRRICATKGGFLGLIPELSEEGDLICIITGSPAPFVGRRVGNAIRLVGMGYINGLMGGEAYCTKLEEQNITIC